MHACVDYPGSQYRRRDIVLHNNLLILFAICFDSGFLLSAQDPQVCSPSLSCKWHAVNYDQVQRNQAQGGSPAGQQNVSDAVYHQAFGLNSHFVLLCAGQMVLLARKSDEELPAEKPGVTSSTGPQVLIPLLPTTLITSNFTLLLY